VAENYSSYKGIIRDSSGRDLILGADNKLPMSRQSYPNTPMHRNVTLTLGDTEYSITLPQNTRAFMFQNRGANAIRFAFEGGKVATPTAPYFTLKGGAAYSKEDVNFSEASGGILYFGIAPANSGDIVEVEAWHD